MTVTNQDINKKVTTCFIDEKEIKDAIINYALIGSGIINNDKTSVRIRLLNEDSSTGFHPRAIVDIEEFR